MPLPTADDTVARRPLGPAFSCTKCPPGPGLENSCELPFGFVWTPLEHADEADQVAVVDLTKEDSTKEIPAIMCLTCLAYLNLYAEGIVSEDENGDDPESRGPQKQYWSCPLCGSINAMPKETATHLAPMLASPTVEILQQIGTSTCKDTINLILVLDANLPTDQAQAVGEAIEQLLSEEKKRKVHLGLVIFGKHVSIYKLGGNTTVSQATIVTLEDGGTWDPEQGEILQKIENENDLKSLWRCLVANYGVDIPPMLQTAAQQRKGLSSTRAPKKPEEVPMTRLEMLKKRKEERLARKHQEEMKTVPNGGCADPTDSGPSPWLVHDQPAYRCTAEAVQCAMDIAALPTDARTARIFLVTNGCPNQGMASVVLEEPRPISGEGEEIPMPVRFHDIVDRTALLRSKEVMEELGRNAAESGIGIDVFCTGASELTVPTFQALSDPSAGYTLLHDDASQFTHNMGHLWHQTALSGLYTEEEEGFDGVVLDVRMSR